MAPQNKAAVYPSDKAPALVIQDAPYPTAGEGEVVIRVAATAVNPVDHTIQDRGTELFPFLTYPLTGGLDVAGTIVDSGSGSAFRPGDRVLAFTSDFVSRAGAFQNYAVARTSTTSRIPDSLSFVDAVVVPSAVATAAVSLYQFLGLEPPSTASPKVEKKGETVLVTAGASSVGSSAIQLAVASGYDVITTSSPRNFAHCAALGASRVIDYGAADLADQVKAAVRGSSGSRLAGAVSCVPGSNALAFDVVGELASSESAKSVACTILPPPLRATVPEGVRAEMIHAYWIKDTPLAETIYRDFLPAALAAGAYKCVPRPRVVGRGLGAVQAAFDIGKTNTVSCEKLVVALEEAEEAS
ncbi:GroES-like protein [Nemania sp. NC0429]|nr:GroES-like protein [Nemania sp. NC0429]